MLTDAKLRAAAADAEQYFLSYLSERYTEPHVFSSRFEKKMSKLIRRANSPVRHQITRWAVAAVLAIAILFGTLFAFSPEVRADVIRWFKSTFEEFFSYTNEGTNEQTRHDYHLGNIPDGYREVTVIDTKDGKKYLYASKSGHILQFSYAYGARTNGRFIKVEDYTKITGTVNDLTADIYLTEKENETNVIIWRDLESDVLFAIFMKADKDILIELAESVQVK